MSRKSSGNREPRPYMNANFRVDRDLYEDYKRLAKRREQTLSQALRLHMRERVEKEAA